MHFDDCIYGFLVPADRGGRRGSLAAQVAGQLRHAIISFKLPPGTMLDKSKICCRLNVSRSPVAEAFARLQAEGLLDILPQRGSMVSYVSLATVKEYVFIRKALEGETVRALAQERPPVLLAVLKDNIEAQRQAADAGSRESFHLLDLQFHDYLVGALSFRRMKAIIDSVRNNLDRARQMTNTPERIAEGIDEHAAIVAAIEAGDGSVARRRMHHHLDGIVAEVEGLAKEHPEFFAEHCGLSRFIGHDHATICRLPSP